MSSQVRILFSPQGEVRLDDVRGTIFGSAKSYLVHCKIVLRNAGVAQLVERQPSKLQVAGSNLVSRSYPPEF